MNRLGLLGSLALILAACGGGGGSDSGGKCGNSVVDGSEQCDDGNTANGDGCDSTCRTERTGACGDGTFDVQYEQCDDGNTVSGDGCDADCNLEGPPSVCGDGITTGSEQCDDDNTDSGDGCSSTCQTEHVADGTCGDPITIDLESNDGEVEVLGDTSTGMNGFAATACDGTADVGEANDLTYKIVLTTSSNLDIFSYDQDFTSAVRLTTTACDGTTEVIQSNETPTGCQLDEFPDLEFVALPAGTYYLTVDGATATDVGTFDFDLYSYESFCGDGFVDSFDSEDCDDNNNTDGDGCDARCFIETGFLCDNGSDDEGPSVCVPDTCGNGVMDTGEQCDDGNHVGTDGCTKLCQIDPLYTCTGFPSTCTPKPAVCGDNLLEVGEECEDHNTANSDGCSSMCKLEFDVTDTEPNNTTPQILTAGSHRIKGSLTADDVDEYKFTLAAATHLAIESYTTIDSSRAYTGVGDNRYDCVGTNDDADPVMDVYMAPNDDPSTDDYIIRDDDDGAHNQDSDGYGCTYIGNNDSDGETTEGMFAAGTYTITFANHGGGAMSRYLIDLRIIP